MHRIILSLTIALFIVPRSNAQDTTAIDSLNARIQSLEAKVKRLDDQTTWFGKYTKETDNINLRLNQFANMDNIAGVLLIAAGIGAVLYWQDSQHPENFLYAGGACYTISTIMLFTNANRLRKSRWEDRARTAKNRGGRHARYSGPANDKKK